MQMVAPCPCRMAEERDVRKSMDTLAKQLTMDVDTLKSQHNRLHSQVGQGGLCEHAIRVCNWYLCVCHVLDSHTADSAL